MRCKDRQDRLIETNVTMHVYKSLRVTEHRDTRSKPDMGNAAMMTEGREVLATHPDQHETITFGNPMDNNKANWIGQLIPRSVHAMLELGGNMSRCDLITSTNGQVQLSPTVAHP